MKQRKIPMRSCIITGEKLPKLEMFRIVRMPDGEVAIENDLRGKTNGRGAYLKKDIEVIEKARKTKILEKKLEAKIPDNIYDELINKL